MILRVSKICLRPDHTYGEQASHWSRDDGDSRSPLVSGPIRGQRAQTIAGLPSASVSAEKHKMFAGEALKRAGC